MFGNFEFKNDGVCLYWANGNPRLEIAFKNNALEGPVKIYYKTGETMFAGNITKGEDEFRLKKYRKHGEEVKTTKWSVSEISEVIPLPFLN